MIDFRKNIRELISFLYNSDQANDLFNSLWGRIESFKRDHPKLQTGSSRYEGLSESEVILITYGDQFREAHRPPLESLNTFLQSNLKDRRMTAFLLSTIARLHQNWVAGRTLPAWGETST